MGSDPADNVSFEHSLTIGTLLEESPMSISLDCRLQILWLFTSAVTRFLEESIMSISLDCRLHILRLFASAVTSVLGPDFTLLVLILPSSLRAFFMLFSLKVLRFKLEESTTSVHCTDLEIGIC